MLPTEQITLPYVLAWQAFPVGTTTVPAIADYDFLLTDVSVTSHQAGEAALSVDDAAAISAAAFAIPASSDTYLTRSQSWSGHVVVPAGEGLEVVVEGTTLHAVISGWLLLPVAADILPT